MMIYEARLAQLNPLAQRALTHFGLSDATLALVSYAHNAVYEVRQDDVHAVLRVYAPRAKAEIDSELAWLKAIDTQTDLTITKPMCDLYTDALDGEPVYAVLLQWVAGERIAPQDIQPHHAHATGKAIATLHNQSQAFTPPPGFTRPALDWSGLFGKRSPYYSETESELFTAEQRQTMQKVAEKMRDVMSAANGYGMIHADLIAKNIVFVDENGEQVALIDFDNCAYGYYLYDLAPFLWGLRDQPQYGAIKQALWDGYTTVRDADDDAAHLEAFVAARHVASCRWVAASTHLPSIRDRAPQIIAERVREMENYLTTGMMGT